MNECTHEEAFIDESHCGHIAILCCKIPLAEIRESCSCSFVTFKDYWGYISEDEAWAIYKREGGKQERKTNARV